MQPGDLVQCVRTPVDPIFGPLEATGLVRGALYVVVRFHTVENDPEPGLVVRSCATGQELPGEILVEGLSGKTHVGRCYHASLFRPFIEKPPADARYATEDVEGDAMQESADRFTRRCFGTVKGSRAKPVTTDEATARLRSVMRDVSRWGTEARFYDTTLPPNSAAWMKAFPGLKSGRWAGPPLPPDWGHGGNQRYRK